MERYFTVNDGIEIALQKNGRNMKKNTSPETRCRPRSAILSSQLVRAQEYKRRWQGGGPFCDRSGAFAKQQGVSCVPAFVDRLRPTVEF